MVTTEEVMISEAEAALYDRQIRLWGLEAQKRLRGARVLLIGLGGLGAEIAKNLTLSGVRSIMLLDDRPVSENVAPANFLLTHDDNAKTVAEACFRRLQRLNPMVEVVVETGGVSDKADEYFGAFDTVCATRLTAEESIRINDACRKRQVPFFSGDVFGFGGFFFADLLEHEYAEEVSVPVATKEGADETGKAATMEVRTVKKTLDYVPFKAAWSDVDYSRLNRKSWKRIQPHIVLMKTLLTFRSQEKRDPEAASGEADLERLQQIKDHVLHDLKLDADIVDRTALKSTLGESSAAAAVLGGVLAQEVIKAVSHKDQPIRNVFLFNGATDRAGLVEALGF